MDDRERLTRYLLGRLDEPAMAALEEQYFRDREAFESLEAILDDLADAYAQGTLSPDDRLAFEQRYGSTADGRSRIAFARAFASHGAPAPTAKPGRTWLFPMRAAGAFRRQPWAAQLLAAAAVLVLLVGGPVTVARNAHMRREVDLLNREVRDLTSVAATERERREALERRLNELSTAAFELLPGTDRGGGETLVVPRAADFVRLQLALESVPAPGALRVTVLTPGGATVWSQVVADSAPRGLVEATVPASLLAPGEYQVRLGAHRAGGGSEPLASYGVRIVRR